MEPSNGVEPSTYGMRIYPEKAAMPFSFAPPRWLPFSVDYAEGDWV